MPLDVAVDEDPNRREKKNLELPAAMMKELDALKSEYGGTQLFILFSAAVLLFLEAPDEVKQASVLRVTKANMTREFVRLVREAKAQSRGEVVDLEEKGDGDAGTARGRGGRHRPKPSKNSHN